MMLVDNRNGSIDLAEPLKKAGLPVVVTRLEFGDFAFEGRGANGTVLNIGVELKRLTDLVSSIRTGRISGHQLPGLVGPNGAYDYTWIVVEGLWRVDNVGRIIVKRYSKRERKNVWVPLPGGMLASEMVKHVLTLELCAGCHVRFTNSDHDTVQFLSTLYHWWTDKDMDQHTSHLAPQKAGGYLPISDYRDIVRKLPGIGLRTSLAVETHFGADLIRTICAGTNEWAEVTTVDRNGKAKKLGMKVAQKLVDWIAGRNR